MRLRELRNSLGMTVEEVAEQLLCSATKISRIETSARRASLRDVRDLCQIYGIGEQGTAELMELARQAREPSWWTRYEDLKLSPYIGLEQNATAITAFAMYWVPALLQTENYAQAMIMGIERKVEPAVLDLRIGARMRRQELLQQGTPPRYRALLDEAVLRRRVGGPPAVRAQLDKILACVAEGKAVVHVIPSGGGAHASTDSNFAFLEFGDNSPRRPVGFIEGIFSNRYIERLGEIERYREAIEYLRDPALIHGDTTCLNRDPESEHPL